MHQNVMTSRKNGMYYLGLFIPFLRLLLSEKGSYENNNEKQRKFRKNNITVPRIVSQVESKSALHQKYYRYSILFCNKNMKIFNFILS